MIIINHIFLIIKVMIRLNLMAVEQISYKLPHLIFRGNKDQMLNSEISFRFIFKHFFSFYFLLKHSMKVVNIENKLTKYIKCSTKGATMMKVQLRMMHLAISTTMILILLLVYGCGKSPQQKLVGTWQDPSGGIGSFLRMVHAL